MVLHKIQKHTHITIAMEHGDVLASLIWDSFGEHYPNTMNSIQPLLENPDKLQILSDQVQSGKSHSIMLMIWYYSFINKEDDKGRMRMPIFLTKNSKIVRMDFMQKMTNFLLYPIIDDVIKLACLESQLSLCVVLQIHYCVQVWFMNRDKNHITLQLLIL